MINNTTISFTSVFTYIIIYGVKIISYFDTNYIKLDNTKNIYIE